jgi:hypothetical protein
VVLSPELQPGEISNIADRNVVITALPNMTRKTVIDLYHPMTPLPRFDTTPFLPHIFTLPPLGALALHSLFLYSDTPPPRHTSFRSAQVIFEPKLLPCKYPDNIIPVILPTYTAIMMMEQCVPKRRNIKFRSRGTTKKKEYNIQNTAKV